MEDLFTLQTFPLLPHFPPFGLQCVCPEVNWPIWGWPWFPVGFCGANPVWIGVCLTPYGMFSRLFEGSQIQLQFSWCLWVSFKSAPDCCPLNCLSILNKSSNRVIVFLGSLDTAGSVISFQGYVSLLEENHDTQLKFCSGLQACIVTSWGQPLPLNCLTLDSYSSSLSTRELIAYRYEWWL